MSRTGKKQAFALSKLRSCASPSPLSRRAWSLMPSFVNIGPYVDKRHNGRHMGDLRVPARNRQESVHLSGRRWHCGVLETMQAGPKRSSKTICFTGALRSCRRLHRGAPGSCSWGWAFYIGQSTKFWTRKTGEVFYGEVPAGSSVVAGSIRQRTVCTSIAASIVKRVDEKNTLEKPADQRAFCATKGTFHRSVSSLSETSIYGEFEMTSLGWFCSIIVGGLAGDPRKKNS